MPDATEQAVIARVRAARASGLSAEDIADALRAVGVVVASEPTALELLRDEGIEIGGAAASLPRRRRGGR